MGKHVTVEAAKREWVEQTEYHLERARQEQRMSAEATTPEARAAHLLLSQGHLALSGAADAVSAMDDPAGFRPTSKIDQVLRQAWDVSQLIDVPSNDPPIPARTDLPSL